MEKGTKWSQVLLWSVISAAFIGPGTVTTASKSGYLFGWRLLPALLFSVLATMLLQEGAARLRIISGKSMGDIIRQSEMPRSLTTILFLAICFGCAAYQAGNILGAVSGMDLIFSGSTRLFTLIMGIIAALFLWTGSVSYISKLLAILVALMGLCFGIVAFQIDWASFNTMAVTSPFDWDNYLLMTVALVGTTIVPYNLFLGNGVARGATSLSSMRFGLLWAVFIGGCITACILIAGCLVQGTFSFETLASALDLKLGKAGRYILGLGLMCAGLSSAITAPLAAAITGRSLFSQNPSWQDGGKNFRLTWLVILLIGIAFGVAQIKPIPAIIGAQAINGILLPFVVLLLFWFLNDEKLMGASQRNFTWFNLAYVVVIFLTSFLGIQNVLKAAQKTFKIAFLTNPFTIIYLALGLGLLLTIYAWMRKKKYGGV